MKIYKAHLKSISPYSQARHHNTPKLEEVNESHAAHEKRTWREKLHTNKEELVFIPPMSFKRCLDATAKYLSINVPGKGSAKFTKHFEAGVMVTEPLVLLIKKGNVESEELFVPADGRRGGSTRVWKTFPIIQEWEGEVIFLVLDEIITKDVFKKHLDMAGKFIGIGRFRPEKAGYYGRFKVVKIQEVKEDS